ncbi:MAG: endonuclease MutS2 [Cytophagaceae bacterium]|nr:endonuclease MutS2 [Cytophagaceae bacterium]
MLYPENIEQKLGFDQVRECVRKECASSLGEKYVQKMRFSDDYEMITRFLDQAFEFKNILDQNLNFPSQYFIDVTPFLQKIKPAASFVESEELRDIKVSLFTIFSCIDFFDKRNEFPVLKELIKGIELDKNLYKEIDRLVTDKGEIKDDASPELKDIRRNLISEQSRLRKELERLVKSYKKEGYVDEELSVTIRNGRMVIPVVAEHKRKVKGFVHDESATGQTLFIEPSEVIEINNQIRELELQERREIVRILTLISDKLRSNLPQLMRSYDFLGMIDFIRAKARFAIKIKATKPGIIKSSLIKWNKARHPLLYLTHQKNNKEVIPLSIELNPGKRILIISGPNAGGKSVALKTIGLLQYMMQCGLLVHVEESSQMGVFRNIFIDIGDDQSLENDLSTYSSHLNHMKNFTSFADPKTLVLIDEFGTGTEPNLGGAIAESVLEKLNKRRTFGVITTHYANLKAFAEKAEGIINGAMRFNTEKLQPLYELEIGKPGSSFAFEIAKKIGLPEDILESSRKKLGNTQIDFDKLIAELEVEKTKLKELNSKLEEKEKGLNKTIEEYNTLKEFIEENRKKLLNDAKQQAKDLLNQANQKIENTIREIKEHKAEKDITKELRSELEDFKNTLKPEEENEKPEEVEGEQGEINAGDLVRVKDTGAMGEVITLKGKDADILIGSLKSTQKVSRLEKISRKVYKDAMGVQNESTSGVKINKSISGFFPQIDLRGKRGEEALSEVDSLLDNALIFGVQEIKIIHGKGDGILRTLIRNQLKKYKQVKSMSDEHADRGGAGVTIVKLG